MEKKREQLNARKVLRRLSHRMPELRFRRATERLFVRERANTLEFLSLHKFSFTSAFRVHFGIRVLNDPSPAVSLNGPHSDPYTVANRPDGKKFNLRYHESVETIDRCVDNIIRFCLDVGEPWFETWARDTDLVTSPASPLREHEKEALAAALKGEADLTRVAETKRVFHDV